MSALKAWKRRDTRLRFEQFACHPGCNANVASAVLGVPMHVAAEKERPTRAGTFGQSPFALAQGVTFEKSLFARDAERLRSELARAAVIPSPEATFIDLRLHMNGGRGAHDLKEAAAKTDAVLRDAASGLCLPIIVAGASLTLPGQPVLLPEAALALDALVIRPAVHGAELVVGEVKTYPDRAGFTDRAQLATARAQAGAYAHALEVTLERLGIAERVSVCAQGFLVLARPGSAFPRVRAGEELQYQATRAERGFALLRAASRDLEKVFAEPPSDAEPDAVLSAATCYRASCVSFCERAEACHEAAFRRGDPAVLGDDAKKLLGELRLDRAAALLDGATPETAAERSFVARARDLGGVRL